MIGLSNETKDEMLGAFAGKQFLLALYSGEEEIQDAMYARREVLFSAPLGDQVRYVENVEIVRFEGFNNRHLIDHWAVLNPDGTAKAVYKVVEPIEVSSVVDCKFRPGELRIGLP